MNLLAHENEGEELERAGDALVWREKYFVILNCFECKK
jgi:hypothetical protein